MEKKIGMGIIGLGTWGTFHAWAYNQHPNAELIGVCDINEKTAKEAAESFKAKNWYTDYNEMLENPDVEAVSVVLPDFLHREPVIAAAEAGKHILCEKPLATSVNDAETMVDTVKKAHVKFMVDFHNRWNPPFGLLKYSIEKGELGDPIYAYIRQNNTLYVPEQMLSWASKTKVLWFLGSHAIDLIRWLFNDEPEEVHAVSRSLVLKSKGVNTEDFYQATIQFKKGGVVNLETLWILPNTFPSVVDFFLEFVGSKGTTSINAFLNTCIEKYTEEKYLSPDVLAIPMLRGKPRGFGIDAITYFVDCLVEDKDPEVSYTDGLNVTKTICAIIESAENGRGVKVNI